VNTRLILLEVHVSYTDEVRSITLTVDLPLKPLSASTIFCVDRRLYLCLGGAA